jgi:alpha-methylacyl-CoA racemase
MGPGPFASMLLSDMGADVVRVVRGGLRDPNRSLEGPPAHLDVVNRGTTSIAVDLKRPEGVTEVLALASQADVLIEGFRPGVTERLGLGPDVVQESNPRIVYARLTGYGQTGPLARVAGHDINYVAQSGVLSALARAGEAPRPPLNLLGDYAGGGAVAAFGIVAALYESAKSGLGQVLDASMVDGTALLSAKIQGLRAAGLFSDKAGTNTLDSGAPFYESYACSDGRYVAVGALEPVFYQEFVSRLGVDVTKWPDQQDRERWPRLRELIAATLGSRTRDEWAEIYAGTDACVSPVLSFEEAAADAHNHARILYQHTAGAMHPSPTPRMSRTAPRRPQAPEPVPVTSAAVMQRWSG